MKHKFLLLILVLIASPNFGQSQNQETYASSISADELKEKLYTYASDEFEGRETGTKGSENGYRVPEKALTQNLEVSLPQRETATIFKTYR